MVRRDIDSILSQIEPSDKPGPIQPLPSAHLKAQCICESLRPKDVEITLGRICTSVVTAAVTTALITVPAGSGLMLTVPSGPTVTCVKDVLVCARACTGRPSTRLTTIATADGRALKPSLIRAPKNRYALVKQSSVRWTNEESISIEVKLCPFARGKTRNKECEDDSDIRYRRRTVKLGQ